MRQPLNMALRRLLEVVLVVLTATIGLALLHGHVSAAALGAGVSAVIAISVALDQLNPGRRGRCSHRAGR